MSRRWEIEHVERPSVETRQPAIDELTREVARLRASRERLVLTADTDRHDLERDLHDGLQQQLVALSVDLQLARQVIGGEPEAAPARLEELGRSVQAALEEAARLAMRIHPPLLSEGGLGVALRSAAHDAAVRTRLDVNPATDYPRGAATTIYLCWLALLDGAKENTEAYATVTRAGAAVVFELAATADSAEVVRDAIVGRMHDRVDALGGGLTVSAESNDRLRVIGSFPVSR